MCTTGRISELDVCHVKQSQRHSSTVVLVTFLQDLYRYCFSCIFRNPRTVIFKMHLTTTLNCFSCRPFPDIYFPTCHPKDIAHLEESMLQVCPISSSLSHEGFVKCSPVHTRVRECSLYLIRMWNIGALGDGNSDKGLYK